MQKYYTGLFRRPHLSRTFFYNVENAENKFHAMLVCPYYRILTSGQTELFQVVSVSNKYFRTSTPSNGVLKARQEHRVLPIATDYPCPQGEWRMVGHVTSRYQGFLRVRGRSVEEKPWERG